MHKVETNDNHYITKERKYARGKKKEEKTRNIYTIYKRLEVVVCLKQKTYLKQLTFNYIIPITRVPLLTLNYKY